MKKITFLLSLLLASAGVTASAQDAFVASSAPSNGSWASDTKWYKMSLSGNYLSAYDADVNGNVRAAATEAPTGAGAYWCIVADGENGYKREFEIIFKKVKSRKTSNLQRVAIKWSPVKIM